MCASSLKEMPSLCRWQVLDGGGLNVLMQSDPANQPSTAQASDREVGTVSPLHSHTYPRAIWGPPLVYLDPTHA